MDKNVYICTWIYCDSKEEESLYCQVGANSSDLAFQLVYWRCLVTYFATSIRNNVNVHHILFTNKKEIPDIEGFETAKFFEENEIEVVRLPYTCKMPRNDFSAWGNQFYIFDILKHVSKSDDIDDNIYIILDSDCVFINPIDRIVDLINLYDILTYESNYNTEHVINGLTRLDMKEIYEEIDGRILNEVPKYFNGEWFGAKVKVIKDVVRIYDEAKEVMYKRVQCGKKSFNEEAHLLSYIYYKLGYPLKTVNQQIRRIWTGSNFRNVKGDEFSLDIWHIPSEKTSGIKTVFNEVGNPESNFYKINSQARFAIYLAYHLGILKHFAREKQEKLMLWFI